MNNVVIIENGQQVNVNLIAYFNTNSVNYVFYTKNETVQDGLIKMYVAKENNGTNISDDEWNNLKKIMQGIIMSNANVSYVKYVNPINIGEARAIALKNENIISINNSYNNNTSAETESGGTNKDLLNQNFAVENPTPEVVAPVQSEPINPVNEQAISNPVQEVSSPIINPIPDVQNNLNMEATPVNLDVSAPVVNENTQDVITPFDPTTTIEPIAPTNSDVSNVQNEPLTINNITPAEVLPNDASVNMDNSFKVTNEPNIFDQVDNSAPVNLDANNNLENPFNNVTTEVKENNNDLNINNSELIELNERKIKLFEELANIYREENQLLSNNNSDLEKTASDLFNNNGTLNENKVLDVNN